MAIRIFLFSWLFEDFQGEIELAITYSRYPLLSQVSSIRAAFVLLLVYFLNSMGNLPLAAQDGTQSPGKTGDTTKSKSFVSLSEFLAKIPANLRMSKTKVFYLRDLDVDFQLSDSELKNSLSEIKNPFWSQFILSDSDKDGLVSEKEYIVAGGKKHLKASNREFLQYDRDQNGQFSYMEYVETPRVSTNPKSRFLRWDQNSDQYLQLTEFLKRFSSKTRDVERRRFYEFDLDGDLKVSLKEFSLPPEKRKPHWRSRFALRDVNTDGRLSHEEYYAPSVGTKWEKDAKAASIKYDRNADGFLSLSEFAWTPNGTTNPQEHFLLLDSDKNSQVSLTEYLLMCSGQKENVLRSVFLRRDSDADSVLSLEEFSAPLQKLPHTLQSRFAELDTDGDGKVSKEEYVSPHIGGKWEKSATRESVSYDLDQDGFLSLQEFVFTPAPQLSPKQRFKFLDSNQDKKLSPKEYLIAYKNSSRRKIADRILFFQRDADNDLFLSLSEYLEQTALTKISNEDLFLALDESNDKFLTLDEYLKRSSKEHRVPESRLFYSYDINGDLKLSQKEFSLPISKRKPHWKSVLASFDLNQDGRISKKEYVLPFQGTEWEEVVKKNAVQYDHNRDGFFSKSEFIFSPESHLSIEQRFDFLDSNNDSKVSLTEFIETRRGQEPKTLRSIFLRRDSNKDSSLDIKEYSILLKDLPHTFRSRYADRDNDGDGKVSREEYFAPHVGGEWEKSAKQEAVDYDWDKNGFLSLEEFAFTPASQLSAKQRFDFLDSDRDKLLSPEEYLVAFKSSTPRKAANRVLFFRRDVNSDNLLSLSEYLESSVPKSIDYQRMFEALDENGDHQLSLEEYYNPGVGTKWENNAKLEASRADLDSNGSLTLLEFALTPRANLDRPKRFHLFDLDKSNELSLTEYLAMFQGSSHAQEQANFYQLDHDKNSKLSQTEFLNNRPIRQLDFNASYQSIDTNSDGRVSLKEYYSPHIGTKFEKSARQEAEYCDVNDDGYLSKIEFVHTPRPDPSDTQLFELLDEDNDGEIKIAELVKFEAAPQKKRSDKVVYEQSLMKIEDKIRSADKDRNGLLSQVEFFEARKKVKQPSTRKRTARDVALQSISGESNNRLIGLLCCTLLLMVGMVWLLVRR